jgi:threo-3-hydroxy-L-aspartate ammonia-lyase
MTGTRQQHSDSFHHRPRYIHPVTDLDIGDVREAARFIAPRVLRTPVLTSPALDEMAGARLYFKAENMQRIHAFKARGAMNAVGRLTPEERARGVITYSSGNHAQAVALAAREHGARAHVTMPTDAPAVKVASVRALGAEITFAGTTSEERFTAAKEIAAKTGGVIIPPFDDPRIVAGQGTATLELFEQVLANTGEKLDALIVPVGGGGLLAGACLAAEAYGARVHSAEPVGCDAMARSLEAGERVAVEPGPTIADGLKPVRVGALNFAIAKRAVSAWHRVDDEAIGRALVALLWHAKTLVEPSGAAAAAVALGRRLPPDARRVGVILSGGNVAAEQVAALLARYGERG